MGDSYPLTDRHQAVLRAIVHMHVDTIAPVGSRALTRRYALGISSATVRTVMSGLEARGLIAPPHTSAGRIPTDSGYRCYVDDLMEPPCLSESEQMRIAAVIGRAELLEDRLTAVAGLLTELAPYTAIIQLPADEALRIREIHLARLTDTRAIAIVVTAGGALRHRTVDIDADADSPGLDRMAHYLTEHLAGTPLGTAATVLAARDPGDGEEAPLHVACCAIARQVAHPGGTARVLLDGTRQLMEQPEFRDRARAHALLELLDAKAMLSAWLGDDRDTTGGVHSVRFRIGAENGSAGAQACALVMVPYRVGTATGHLALLGPTRMRYRRAAALLAFTGSYLTAVGSAAA